MSVINLQRKLNRNRSRNPNAALSALLARITEAKAKLAEHGSGAISLTELERHRYERQLLEGQANLDRRFERARQRAVKREPIPSRQLTIADCEALMLLAGMTPIPRTGNSDPKDPA